MEWKLHTLLCTFSPLPSKLRRARLWHKHSLEAVQGRPLLAPVAADQTEMEWKDTQPRIHTPSQCSSHSFCLGSVQGCPNVGGQASPEAATQGDLGTPRPALGRPMPLLAFPLDSMLSPALAWSSHGVYLCC